MQKILIATRNQNKLKEIHKIFDIIGFDNFEIVGLNDISTIPKNFDVDETGETFAENAVLKARQYGDYAQILTLADDSGLVVDALNGRPGVKSARYAKTDEEKCKKLLHEMKDVPNDERQAYFVCVFALYNPKSGEINLFEGRSEGEITYKMIGNNNFGYDPVFFNKKMKKTYAEMTEAEKNLISHRQRALQKFTDFIKK